MKCLCPTACLQALVFLTTQAILICEAWSEPGTWARGGKRGKGRRPRHFLLRAGQSEERTGGNLFTDGRVDFNTPPAKEWELMATGTGVTGLVVTFPDEMLLQINHASAIDERARSGRWPAALGLDGHPFANSKSFRMETDCAAR